VLQRPSEDTIEGAGMQLQRHDAIESPR
jgi:hypothetical protein